jgi:hypothetical protein
VIAKTSSPTISTRLVSRTPSRVRLKISPEDRYRDRMAKIVDVLEAHPQVQHIKTNTSTGSIVIHHDHGALGNILNALKDLGVIVGDVVGAEIPTGQSEAAANLTSAIADLNQRVERSTNYLIDLRFVFPLGLGILAIRQLVKRGLQFELVPWYVLAWYAFDNFIKLNDTRSAYRQTR